MTTKLEPMPVSSGRGVADVDREGLLEKRIAIEADTVRKLDASALAHFVREEMEKAIMEFECETPKPLISFEVQLVFRAVAVRPLPAPHWRKPGEPVPKEK